MTRLSDRDRMDRSVPEAAVQGTVTDALETYGYVFNHNADSRRSHAGLPDLVAVHRFSGRVLFIECKTELAKLRPEQETWRRAVGRGSALHMVARPSTLDEVVAQIARAARPVIRRDLTAPKSAAPVEPGAPVPGGDAA